MIRFSAFLVAVAVALLVAGVVTSKLMLVYIAIGVSGVALLALGIGAAVNWRELTGKPTTAAAETSAPGPGAANEVAVPATAAPQAPSPAQPQAPAPAHPQAQVPAAAGAAAVGSGWPVAVPGAPSASSAPSRAGYLPTDQPQQARPAAAPPVGAGAPAGPFPPAVRAPAAFTPRREPPARDAARDIGEWRDDSIPAPTRGRPQAPTPGRPQGPPQPAGASAAPEAFAPFRPAGKPASPGGGEVAERPLAAPRQQPSDAKPPRDGWPPGEDQPSARREPPGQAQPTGKDRLFPEDEPPADRQDDAGATAAASGHEPDTVVAATSVAPPASPQAGEPEQPRTERSGQAMQPGQPAQHEQAKQPEPKQAKQPGQLKQPEPEQAKGPGRVERAKGPEPASPDPDTEVTVVPGVPRYHNARCILIRFMGESDLDKMTRAAAREAGCTPCRACLPDQPDKSPE